MAGTRRTAAARARSGLLLVLIGLSAVAGGGERSARAADCFEGITDDETRRIFEVLARVSRGTECTLEEVRTERALVRIQWRKGGDLQEDVLVAPTSCVPIASTRGKVLSTVVPGAVMEACPAQVDALNTLVASDAFGAFPVTAPVPIDFHRTPRSKRHSRVLVGGIAAGLVALAIATFLVLGRRRSGKNSAKSPTSGSNAG